MKSVTVSLVVMLGVLVGLSPADAQNSRPALSSPPPLSCTNSAGTVTIQALTDLSGNFPIQVPCPTTGGPTSCLKWSYRYTSVSGANISLSAMTVDSDVAIVRATSGAGETTGGMKVYAVSESDSSIGSIGLNTWDLSAVKFSANSAVVLGHIYTPTQIGIGSVTAISKVGNAGPSTCRIAGPDNITTSTTAVGVATMTTTQTDEFQGCTITLGLDAKGCPNSVTATGGCSVTEETFLGGQTFLGGNCRLGNGLVTEGSTCVWYCPTSFGTCYKVCK